MGKSVHFKVQTLLKKGVSSRSSFNKSRMSNSLLFHAVSRFSTSEEWIKFGGRRKINSAPSPQFPTKYTKWSFIAPDFFLGIISFPACSKVTAEWNRGEGRNQN